MVKKPDRGFEEVYHALLYFNCHRRHLGFVEVL